MSAIPKEKYLSPEEYLRMERKSLDRHEYFNGEIFQMAGASEEHNTIATNITSSLHQQLKKRPCKVYQTDMRVHIPKTGLYTYPDISVVCGKSNLLEDGKMDTLTNPILIIEILSDSTADYDKGTKFDNYRSLESFEEYVLVWQDKKRIAHYKKQDDESWLLRDFIGNDVEIFLSSIDCLLSVEEIYDKVEMEDSGE